MMWKLLGFTLCLFLSSQFVFGSVWAAAAEPDDVKIEVVFKPEECAQRSKRGDLINAHYDGFLAKDGSQFYCSFVAPETSRNYFLEEVEASRTLTREVTTEWVNVYALYCCRSDKAGHPQWFVLGVGQVIKGLDVGMIDMCAGEKRKVTIPSALAFGEKGKGEIPALLSSDPCCSVVSITFLSGPVPPNATVVFEVEVLSVSRGPRSMEAFGQVDLDRDKMLTKAEVKEYLKLEYEKDGKPRDDPFYEKIINDIFRKSDSDRDGLISAKEYNIYEHDEL